jgi:hypothetical protein
MDPSTPSSQIATEIRPVGWSLEEILRISLAVFLRRFLSLIVPALAIFAALALVDIAFTALLGATEGALHEYVSWTKTAALSLAGIVVAGLSIGVNGFAVFRDLSGQPAGLAPVFNALREHWKRLSTASIFYHLAVLVPAIPGFAVLLWSMQFSMNQQLLPAFGCILAAAPLLYYPFRLFLQMILFAFVATEEGVGGWKAVTRSREWMLKHGTGGVTGNSMFRVFVVLHVSLMPALVVLFLAFIPILFLCAAYSLEQLVDDIRGHHISLPYLIIQALNAVTMTLIVPMFVVPLAVVYRDIVNRLPKT